MDLAGRMLTLISNVCPGVGVDEVALCPLPSGKEMRPSKAEAVSELPLPCL